MELSQPVKDEIVSAITQHLEKGGAFPFEVDNGPFSHIVSQEEVPGKLLISTVTVGGKTYMVNM